MNFNKNNILIQDKFSEELIVNFTSDNKITNNTFYNKIF